MTVSAPADAAEHLAGPFLAMAATGAGVVDVPGQRFD